MNQLKLDLIEDILYFARKYNLEEVYKTYLSQHLAIPELLKLIVYEMFINKFSYDYCSDTDYEHYLGILTATQNLQQKGILIFN